MEEHTNLAPAPKSNRGWFKPDDQRINREGRPRGTPGKAKIDECRASRADRVMILYVRGIHLVHRLSNYGSLVALNLPSDAQIVASLVVGDRVGLVLRSSRFPRIARGALIPEFQAKFDGLWRLQGGREAYNHRGPA